MKNISSSIQIGIRAETAGGTDEARLAFSASAVQAPAGRTGLRRMARIDFHDPMGFVEEHRLNLMPSDVQDGAVKPAFLRHVFAGFGNRAARRFRHVFSAKPLNHDSSKLAGDFGGGFVRPMFTNARSLRAQGGNAALRLPVAVRATFAPAGNALGFADAPIKQRQRLRQLISRTIGQHKRNGDTTIYSDRTANILNVAVNSAADGNLPSKSGAAHSGLGHLAFKVARHAKFDPANFGQAHTSPTMVYALNQHFATIEGKGVVDAFLFWLREATNSLEGAAVGILKGLQRVLLGRLAALSDKIHFGTKRSQFFGLSHVIQIVSCASLIVSPMAAALLKSKVPYQPANPRDLSKLFSLVWRWAQREGKATKNHIKLNITFNPKKQERRAFLPGLNARVSSAIVR